MDILKWAFRNCYLAALLFFSVAFSASAQNLNPVIGPGQIHERLKVIKTFILPIQMSLPSNTNVDTAGALAMIKQGGDTSIFYFTGAQWLKIAAAAKKALDSAYYNPVDGSFRFRYSTGETLEVYTGLVDSLAAIRNAQHVYGSSGVYRDVDTLKLGGNYKITQLTGGDGDLLVIWHISDSTNSTAQSIWEQGVARMASTDGVHNTSILTAAQNYGLGQARGVYLSWDDVVAKLDSAGLRIGVGGLNANKEIVQPLFKFNTVDSTVQFRRYKTYGGDSMLTTDATGKILHKSVQYTIIDKLLAEQAVPIQPTDSVVGALGKLQAQFNTITGKYVSNQTSTYLPESFKISGSANIQATSASGAISLRRGSSLDHYPIVNFQSSSGVNVGYIGAGSNIDENRVDLISLRGGMRVISADTNSIRFGAYTSSSETRTSTGFHNMRWLMYNSAPVVGDKFFDTSGLYRKTLNVFGGLWLDTLFIPGGSAGQQLRYNAGGYFELFTPLTYVRNQIASAESGNSWVDGEHRAGTAFRLVRNGSNSIQAGLMLNNTAMDRGANFQLSGDATPGLSLWVHNGSAWVERVRTLSTGHTGYGTTSPTSTLDINGANGYTQFRLRTSYTPTSSADTNGNTGDISWDANYFYIKTAAGWKRAALTTF